MSESVILDSGDIERIILGNAERIHGEMRDPSRFAIVGIQTRGVELAERIRARLEKLSNAKIKNGTLDITFYRDDLATRGMLPVIKETRIEFNITAMTILLVDDVIFTGRTTKAALETLTTFGRPQTIRLFTLIDRGNRELPIQPDYCGHRIETSVDDKVRVLLRPIDNVDDAVILTTP